MSKLSDAIMDLKMEENLAEVIGLPLASTNKREECVCGRRRRYCLRDCTGQYLGDTDEPIRKVTFVLECLK